MSAFKRAQAVNVELMKQGFYNAVEQDTYDVALPLEFVGFIQDKLEADCAGDADIGKLVAESSGWCRYSWRRRMWRRTRRCACTRWLGRRC